MMEPGGDDRELALQARAGRLEAFDVLVRRYEHALYSYMWRMCRNPAEAEELAQEAFVRAWKGLGGFRGGSSFKTWLFRIATNLCLNRLSRTR
ncbi:sigma-70 family RNA polymerase sigma factor, partial [candidate division WOR-3 bacterium]|nr:sigma-70 family RNA polymerase sigma factor [candidate division WOR-3 bacterium]